MKNPLVYEPTPLPDGCSVRISPSSFSEFIVRPFNWYRQEILK